MVLVRWHYRNGVYVRTHLRRRRARPGTDQTSLLPALLPRSTLDAAGMTRTAAPDTVPAPVLPGQRALPIGAIS
jgi:hypothetical protein